MARPDPRLPFGRLGLLLAILVLPAAKGAEPRPLDLQVKAAFLPKFAAYVNWPRGAVRAPNDPLELCVIGRDPFGALLDDAAAGQQVDQHPIQIRRFDGTANALDCHIAFLGGSTRQSAAAMQEAMKGQPVLTVTDANVGPTRGIVHFALKDGRVRFYIDDAAAARSNLVISARLLSLAIGVTPRARA